PALLFTRYLLPANTVKHPEPYGIFPAHATRPVERRHECVEERPSWEQDHARAAQQVGGDVSQIPDRPVRHHHDRSAAPGGGRERGRQPARAVRRWERIVPPHRRPEAPDYAPPPPPPGRDPRGAARLAPRPAPPPPA